MQYFFVPGSFPDLSFQELESVCGWYLSGDFRLTDEGVYFMLETEVGVETMYGLFERLGGFIKFGILVEEQDAYLERHFDKKKLTFGISVYGNSPESADLPPEKLANLFKRQLKEAGVKANFIKPKRGQLSSAQILHNKILETGFELNIFNRSESAANRDGGSQMVFGETKAVQDLEEFVERDMGRPVIDSKMGILPSKLARMMVNFAEIPAGKTVWDPFCGSGTVLVEALSLGYNALGSDISPEALAISKQNIAWLSEKGDLGMLEYNLFHLDVRNYGKSLLRRLRDTEIDAVIFEPYMGPPQRNVIHLTQANSLHEKVKAQLDGLFSMLERMGKPEITVIGLTPAYKTNKGWLSLRYNEVISKRWNVKYRNSLDKPLHWERFNSIIRRELFIARMKKSESWN